MKIRMGFVSNSSSSSFIVGVPSLPKVSMEERMKVFQTIMKEYDYTSEEIPFEKGMSLDACQKLAEEGYRFSLVDVDFNCEGTLHFIEDIDGIIVADLNY